MDFGSFPLPVISNCVLRHFRVIVGVHLGLAAKVEFKTTVLYLVGKELFCFLGAGIPLALLSLVQHRIKGEATKVNEKPVNQV